MNVKQLINILQEMDDEADICLLMDSRAVGGDWKTELVQLELDDVVIGSSYIGFQVPSEYSE
jgi:hypothetical protein